MASFFFFAGEPSGDLHGAHLIEALKKKDPALRPNGVGGPHMRKAGLHPLLPMESFAVMGFSDVIWALPRLVLYFNKIKKHILTHSYATVVLIDYPGFNLRLARALRKKGYKGKIVHYISPSVWAHGEERITTMADSLDLLLTIYPFEKPYYAKTSLQVEYVGNPVYETIENHLYQKEWRKELSIPEKKQLIALFPGSRKGEILRHLPEQLKALKLIQAQFPDACFALSCASDEIKPLIDSIAQKSCLEWNQDLFLVPKHYSYELMKDSRASIAKSGTVTLELALSNCPTTVIYALTPLNRFIATYWLKLNLPYYCIVNLLGEKEIFPEMIEKGFTADAIAQSTLSLFAEGEKRQKCLEGCDFVRSILQTPMASHNAAASIWELSTC